MSAKKFINATGAPVAEARKPPELFEPRGPDLKVAPRWESENRWRYRSLATMFEK